MNLTFKQLSTFLEVLRSGSLSQAARTVGRTQPAISSMISGLEKELGFQLFLRKQGKLIPTPEAQYFREECEEILSRLEKSKYTLRGIANQRRGALRIACHPAASTYLLPKTLEIFLADKPEVKVMLTMRSSNVIEDLVASHQVDIGFAETPKPRATIQRKVFDTDCLVALSRNSPLAKKQEITPQDLNGVDLALLYAEHATARQTKEIFERSNCHLKLRFELRTFFSGLPLVEAGMCAMICDTVSAYSYQQVNKSDSRIVFRPFFPRVLQSIAILTSSHSAPSMLTTSFLQLLIDRVNTLQDRMLT